jgi:RimJ/RimL family protein N-acetyltransferase
MNFVTGGVPTPREEIEKVVLPRGSPTTPCRHIWVLGGQEKATGRFIGWFHFRPGEGHAGDEPELVYRLHRSAWGKGYATEGLPGR